MYLTAIATAVLYPLIGDRGVKIFSSEYSASQTEMLSCNCTITVTDLDRY